MKQERTISAYKNYFTDFISSLKKEEARKIYYILDMLKVQESICVKSSMRSVLNMEAISSGYSSYLMTGTS